MAEVDWIRLWRELVEGFQRAEVQSDDRLMARWGKRAHSAGYTEERRKRDRDDPLMHYVIGHLDPGDTVLDIGAGIGRWSIPMAKVAHKVTALDALPGMLEIVRENAAAEGVHNIETFQGDWATVEVEPHDVTLSSHAVYTSPDIVGYARKMARFSRKACYMVMRVPQHDGVIGELSQRIHGRWHDSPNFVAGYNALLQAGINGSVLMDGQVRLWHNPTLEEALARVKRHLHLHDTQYDAMILETLGRRLVMKDGEYYWPDGMRSALVWWSPDLPPVTRRAADEHAV
jgi:SAM-dependent methyltransferase